MKINPQLKEELKKYLQSRILESKRKLTIVSAYALDKREIAAIVSTLPDGSHIEPTVEVDKTILGGIIIKYGSKVIDLSLANQLDIFKKHVL